MTKRYLLKFSNEISEKPIISNLVKSFNLQVNIYRAKINKNEEGYMILDLSGDEDDIKNGILLLNEQKVKIEEDNTGILRDEELCTNCGNCISHCPTNALYIPDKKNMVVEFQSHQCIECLNCIKNCPFGACSSIFQ